MLNTQRLHSHIPPATSGDMFSSKYLGSLTRQHLDTSIDGQFTRQERWRGCEVDGERMGIVKKEVLFKDVDSVDKLNNKIPEVLHP